MEDEIYNSPVASPHDSIEQPTSRSNEQLAPRSPSPLPPLLARRQPILIYSQIHNPLHIEHTSRGFYDPNTLYNEFGFTLEGDQEYIILIQNYGCEPYYDNHIFKATINMTNGPLEINPEQEPHCVCLLIRHLGPDVNLTVAPRTPLAFLLENARVSIRMCYITNVAEFCLQHDQESIVTEPKSVPNTHYLTTYSPALRSIPSMTQQTMARHPLLLRRMQNLPKLSPLIVDSTSAYTV
jgi:hypothetical protein